MTFLHQPQYRRSAVVATLAIVLSLLIGLALRPRQLTGQEPTAADELLAHGNFLASPALTGRGVATPGIKLARDYIAAEFAKYGLLPAGDDNSYLQRFAVAVGVTVKAPTSLVWGEASAAQLHEDWLPLGLSSSDRVEAEAVFAGYGITAKDYGYDDYDGIDAKGKIVIVLRYEPPPKKAQSPFRNAPDFSNYAALRTKANNARDHGAIGMILVDMDNRGPAKTELMSLRSSLWRAGNSLVAAQVKRQIAERWFTAQGLSLQELKDKIDRDEQPASLPLAPTKVAMQVTLEEERELAENVVAVLPGNDSMVAGEYIVIGAHYDHLGHGHYGAREQSAAGLIHHGADDNASGTAVLLQVARRLSQIEPKPARSIVFVAFSAEELGLHGSRYFVGQWPQLGSIKTMINLDMVGRLRDNRVTLFGTRSAPQFESIIASGARQLALEINQPEGLGPSDHLSFYDKQIPVLHFFTGSHGDYHRPSDTWDKLNYDGIARIADLVLGSALAIAALPQAPNFVSLPSRRAASATGDRRLGGAYLGIIPEYASNVNGVLLAGVAPASPAAAAGLREGDVIIQFADKKISNIEDLTDALGSRKAAELVIITVQRQDGQIALNATLGARR